jgi:hypothetical protein
MNASFAVCVAVTTVSSLVSLGFSIAATRREGGAALTMARYAASRSIALAISSFVPILSGSVAWAQATALAMTIVQGIDAAIGWGAGDNTKTFGPAATAVINLAVLIWLVYAV